MLSDSQIERYARQLVMSEIDDEGQEKLLEAKILVVGAGGLGASALTTLVSAGVGNIGIIDGDNVDLSNLNRQFIHSIHSINTPKTESAATFLQQLNPESKLTLHEGQLTAESANDIIPAYDMVLDCTDRPETRYLINQQCLNHSKPLIFGGAIRTDGQVTAVFPAEETSPCLQCIFPSSAVDYDQAPNCAQSGILGATTMIIGSLQAQEAIKYVTGFGVSLCGKLLLYDGAHSEFMTISTYRDQHCSACAKAQR